MKTWQSISLSTITIVCALIIRFFLDIPFVKINDEFMSTNEVIDFSLETNETVEAYFIEKAQQQNVDGLLEVFATYKQTNIRNQNMLLKAYDVVVKIADLIIIIMLFYIAVLISKHKRKPIFNG